MWIMYLVWPLTALWSGQDLPKAGPLFWFMMQVAMFLGFSTAFPINWWLVRRGIKREDVMSRQARSMFERIPGTR
jgi:Domain of unknown function (DUF4396)